MRVGGASQLRSKSVAEGVMTYTDLGALPAEAMATGKFAERINNFWDSYQGLKPNLNDPNDFRSAITPTRCHLQF